MVLERFGTPEEQHSLDAQSQQRVLDLLDQRINQLPKCLDQTTGAYDNNTKVLDNSYIIKRNIYFGIACNLLGVPYPNDYEKRDHAESMYELRRRQSTLCRLNQICTWELDKLDLVMQSLQTFTDEIHQIWETQDPDTEGDFIAKLVSLLPEPMMEQYEIYPLDPFSKPESNAAVIFHEAAKSFGSQNIKLFLQDDKAIQDVMSYLGIYKYNGIKKLRTHLYKRDKIIQMEPQYKKARTYQRAHAMARGIMTIIPRFEPGSQELADELNDEIMIFLYELEAIYNNIEINPADIAAKLNALKDKEAANPSEYYCGLEIEMWQIIAPKFSKDLSKTIGESYELARYSRKVIEGLHKLGIVRISEDANGEYSLPKSKGTIRQKEGLRIMESIGMQTDVYPHFNFSGFENPIELIPQFLLGQIVMDISGNSISPEFILHPDQKINNNRYGCKVLLDVAGDPKHLISPHGLPIRIVENRIEFRKPALGKQQLRVVRDSLPIWHNIIKEILLTEQNEVAKNKSAELLNKLDALVTEHLPVSLLLTQTEIDAAIIRTNKFISKLKPENPLKDEITKDVLQMSKMQGRLLGYFNGLMSFIHYQYAQVEMNTIIGDEYNGEIDLTAKIEAFEIMKARLCIASLQDPGFISYFKSSFIKSNETLENIPDEDLLFFIESYYLEVFEDISKHEISPRPWGALRGKIIYLLYNNEQFKREAQALVAHLLAPLND